MSPDQKIYKRHCEDSAIIPASADEIFSFIDNPSRLSSHMSKSSWMMGGGRMKTSVDDGRGQKVGSHIRLSGKAFGIKIYLDEVIAHYEPPYLKEWETVGTPRLLVIGSYRMGIEIKNQNNGSLLRVFIDYDLPKANVWLGKLFGGMYALWCVQQMIKDTYNNFQKWLHCKRKEFAAKGKNQL